LELKISFVTGRLRRLRLRLCRFSLGLSWGDAKFGLMQPGTLHLGQRARNPQSSAGGTRACFEGRAIEDDGPGVPPTETDLIFRRFYRSEKSRCTPGNGLGLSLVAVVARVHLANIKLFPNRPGLTIELLFPPSPPTHNSAQS
jgi:nitrogen-specific signal transduction histidine kinase